jgi:hypothetical protein
VNSHGWTILGMVLLPVVGFSAWLFGQFLSSRREETDAVLRKGLPASAVVVECRPTRRGVALRYRFTAAGRDHPITASAHVRGRRRFEVGDTIAIRYLPAHPHISVVLPRNDPAAAPATMLTGKD